MSAGLIPQYPAARNGLAGNAVKPTRAAMAQFLRPWADE